MTPDEARAKMRAVQLELMEAPRPPKDPRRDMVGDNAWKLLKRAQIGRRRGSRNLQKIHFSALQLLVEIDAPSELVMLFSHLLDRDGVFHKERPTLERDSRQREAAMYVAACKHARGLKAAVARILAGDGDPEAYRKQAAALLEDKQFQRMVEAFRLDQPGK
jgi:hypothetical protein